MGWVDGGMNRLDEQGGGCTEGWMGGWMEGWMGGMDGGMNRLMDEQTKGWVDDVTDFPSGLKTPAGLHMFGLSACFLTGWIIWGYIRVCVVTPCVCTCVCTCVCVHVCVCACVCQQEPTWADPFPVAGCSWAGGWSDVDATLWWNSASWPGSGTWWIDQCSR